MLSGAREAGCFREVAALHRVNLRQVPLYSLVNLVTTVNCYSLSHCQFLHPSASTDYNRRQRSSVYFRAGVKQVTFTVAIRDERLIESNETFYIELEIPSAAATSCNVVKGSPDNATVVIQNDDGECCLTRCKAEHNQNILIALNVHLNITAL